MNTCTHLLRKGQEQGQAAFTILKKRQNLHGFLRRPDGIWRIKRPTNSTLAGPLDAKKWSGHIAHVVRECGCAVVVTYPMFWWWKCKNKVLGELTWFENLDFARVINTCSSPSTYAIDIIFCSKGRRNVCLLRLSIQIWKQFIFGEVTHFLQLG